MNTIIAVAAADPITKAPELVRAYRQAGYQTPLADLFKQTKARQPILPGQTFGLDLDSFVHTLAQPSDNERLIRQEFDRDFRVTLTVGEPLVATVERPSQDRIDRYDAKPYGVEAGTPSTFSLRGKRRQVVPLRRIVQLDFVYFEVAAELWADSLAQGASYQPSLLDPPDGGPGNETAASGPARDQNAAADSDQSASTKLGRSSQSHPTSEREKSQSSFVPRAAHSSNLLSWSNQHDGYRKAALVGAAA